MEHRFAMLPNDAHRQCWQLLPWMVTGSISTNDRAHIERHLVDCAACRAELALQRELYAHFQRDDTVMLAPQTGLQKLMARIEDSVTSLDPRPENARSPAAVEKRPPPLSRWLGVAAALHVLIVGAVLALVWQERQAQWSAPRFTTLSSPGLDDSSTAGATPDNGVILRVVLQPHASNAALQALVRSVDAQLVAGPSEAGVYSLRLMDAKNDADIARALERVRADPNVIFAEHPGVQIGP